MRIKVKVRPNSRESKVVAMGDVLVVHVKSPPREGKANSELTEVLAEYYGVPKSRVRIVRGHRSRDKVVEIEE